MKILLYVAIIVCCGLNPKYLFAGSVDSSFQDGCCTCTCGGSATCSREVYGGCPFVQDLEKKARKAASDNATLMLPNGTNLGAPANAGMSNPTVGPMKGSGKSKGAKDGSKYNYNIGAKATCSGEAQFLVTSSPTATSESSCKTACGQECSKVQAPADAAAEAESQCSSCVLEVARICK